MMTITWKDEQAKYNISAALDRIGLARTRRELDRMLDILGSDVRIRLRPFKDEDSRQVILCLEQVIESESIKLSDPFFDLVTCWGDGTVNIRSAEPEVIAAVCREVLDRIDTRRLINALRDHEPETLDELMSAVSLDQQDDEQLRARLTDTSTTCAVMIIDVDHDIRRLSVIGPRANKSDSDSVTDVLARQEW